MKNKNIIQMVLVAIFVSLMVIALINFLGCMDRKKTDGNVIEASGRISGDEYQTACKFAGKLEEVYVSEGEQAKKGQLVAKLYSAQVQANLESAKKDVSICNNQLSKSRLALAHARENLKNSVNEATADLSVNNAQLTKAQAVYNQTETQLDQAKVQIQDAILAHEQAKMDLVKAKADYEMNCREYQRYEYLMEHDAVPRQQFEAVKARYVASREGMGLAEKNVERAGIAIETSKKSYNVQQANTEIGLAGVSEGSAYVGAGRARLSSSQALIFDVQQAEESVKDAEANLDKALSALKSAKADYEDTKIYAPITGLITRKIVEPGEVIAGGTPVFSMIDMDRLYLRIYLPTDQAGKVKVGDRADIIPDACNKTAFQGEIYWISSQAEFTPKNVETKEQRAKLVFEIKIRALNNRDRMLKPGMPADTRIFISAGNEKK